MDAIYWDQGRASINYELFIDASKESFGFVIHIQDVPPKISPKFTWDDPSHPKGASWDHAVENGMIMVYVVFGHEILLDCLTLCGRIKWAVGGRKWTFWKRSGMDSVDRPEPIKIYATRL